MGTSFLLDKGADIHDENDLPLRWSILSGQFEITKLLLKRGANINAIDNELLMILTNKGEVDMLNSSFVDDIIKFRKAEDEANRTLCKELIEWCALMTSDMENVNKRITALEKKTV